MSRQREVSWRFLAGWVIVNTFGLVVCQFLALVLGNHGGPPIYLAPAGAIMAALHWVVLRGCLGQPWRWFAATLLGPSLGLLLVWGLSLLPGFTAWAVSPQQAQNATAAEVLAGSAPIALLQWLALRGEARRASVWLLAWLAGLVLALGTAMMLPFVFGETLGLPGAVPFSEVFSGMVLPATIFSLTTGTALAYVFHAGAAAEGARQSSSA